MPDLKQFSMQECDKFANFQHFQKKAPEVYSTLFDDILWYTFQLIETRKCN